MNLLSLEEARRAHARGVGIVLAGLFAIIMGGDGIRLSPPAVYAAWMVLIAGLVTFVCGWSVLAIAREGRVGHPPAWSPFRKLSPTTHNAAMWTLHAVVYIMVSIPAGGWVSSIVLEVAIEQQWASVSLLNVLVPVSVYGVLLLGWLRYFIARRGVWNPAKR